jgi:hypothetical protein
MTMDLHADQIQGFFEVPVDHLFASSIFLPHIKGMNVPELVMAAPDTGGTKRANAYAKHLGVDMAICYKQRKVANQVESMTVIGDVAGKNVILVDDMVDTAGTLTKAATMMMEQGAPACVPCAPMPCSAAPPASASRTATSWNSSSPTPFPWGPINSPRTQDQAAFRGPALRRRDPTRAPPREHQQPFHHRLTPLSS